MSFTRLHLYFKAEKLKDMDSLSKSDPYAVLYAVVNGQPQGPVGRTETRQNDLNPVFEKAISVDFMFETKQEFILKLLDDDGKGPAGDDALGNVSFQLAHVVGSRGASLTLDLNPGKVTISAKEESKAGRDTVGLKFSGKALKKMDLFGKSDPYFKLERLLPNGATKLLFQSKHMDGTLDPEWPVLPKLRVNDLTTGNMAEKTLRFSCFDKDVFSDDPMGHFDFSFQELLDAHRTAQPFILAKPEKAGKRYGDIYVTACDIHHYPTFLEYLRGGLQINLAVSIDFTGSNGDPRNPKSLHYMDPVQPNQYVRAIMSVCDILMEYDTDKMVPAFGFGAQEPMPSNAVTHFFHLNRQQNPYVPGVQGILDAYGAALSTMRLAGPTNFAPTISGVRALAMSTPNVYTILLILTDGEITDMDATINAVVGCNDAPMSIVIVGVGNGCDFAMMNQLDGDGQRLRGSNGVQMTRDIVQFVPFRQFLASPPSALAAEVLREIPDQVVDWAMSVNKAPGA
jgi:hypothetical protein